MWARGDSLQHDPAIRETADHSKNAFTLKDLHHNLRPAGGHKLR